MNNKKLTFFPSIPAHMHKVVYNFHKLGIRTKIYVLLLNQLD